MSLDRIKQHFQENKTVYIVGAACLVVGAAGMYFLKANTTLQVNSAQQIKGIAWKPEMTYTNNSTIVTVLERRACMEPIPVRCKETGEVFGSIRRAGQLLDIPRKKIGAQILGKIPSVDGLTFETVTLAE